MTDPYWQGDGITLYLGDSRDIPEWLTADVLVTDPPYGMSYRSGHWGGRTRFAPIVGDDCVDVRDAVVAMWGDRPAAVFGSFREAPFGQPHPMPLIIDKGDVVGMGDLSWPWRPNYELCWIYGSGWAGRRDSAVIRADVLPGNFTVRHHPTQKPRAALEAIIGKAPPGVIADPFAGSGSTLLAARDLRREAIGVEVDEAYCEVIARRLAQGVLV